MRQAGILAAACLYALDHHIDRLAEDHEHAKLRFERIREGESSLAQTPPETDIVVFHLGVARACVAAVVSALRDRGTLVIPFGPGEIRAVPHIGISRDDIEQAAEDILDVVREMGISGK